MQSFLKGELEASAELMRRSAEFLAPEIEAAARIIIEAIESGGKVLLFGNGGSAAEAQHVAAEFTGRFRRERRALPAIALTADVPAITAVGNDYGFDQIFCRQIEALLEPGDAAVALSTSGSSPNVVLGVRWAAELGGRVIALTGEPPKDGDRPLAEFAEVIIAAPSSNAARIQEVHLAVLHSIVGAVEYDLLAREDARDE